MAATVRVYCSISIGVRPCGRLRYMLSISFVPDSAHSRSHTLATFPSTHDDQCTASTWSLLGLELVMTLVCQKNCVSFKFSQGWITAIVTSHCQVEPSPSHTSKQTTRTDRLHQWTKLHKHTCPLNDFMYSPLFRTDVPVRIPTHLWLALSIASRLHAYP